MNRTQQTEFFETYNILQSIKKSQTGCARCIHQMRVILRDHLKQIKTMQTYQVYETQKGTLTFKTTPIPVMTIRANSKLAADEALAVIKKNHKKDEQ